MLQECQSSTAIVEGGDVPSRCTIVGAVGEEDVMLGAQELENTHKTAL